MLIDDCYQSQSLKFDAKDLRGCFESRVVMVI